MEFQKTSTIQFKSLPHIKKMGDELRRDTNSRRRFIAGSKFSIQNFYNSLIIGVYEAEAKGLDFDDVRKRGLLAVLVDMGIGQLEVVAKKQESIPFSGARVQIGGSKRKATAEHSEVEEARPPVHERKLPTFKFPPDFAADGYQGDRVGGAKGEDDSAVNRRVP